MTGHDQSPLTRLVLVMAALAIAASCCAGLIVVFVEQPKMNDVQAPENSISQCLSHCKAVFDSCISQYCSQKGDFRSCQQQCQSAYYFCMTACR